METEIQISKRWQRKIFYKNHDYIPRTPAICLYSQISL